MHATRAYRLQRAILASSSCASGNACDSPQRVVTPERITNWLSSIPTPRQPTPPPRQSEVTPVKPQSPRCNPESVPEPRTPPCHIQSKRLYPGQARPPFPPKPRLSIPIQAKTPSVPTPAAQPAEEQDKPLSLWQQRTLCKPKPKIRPLEPTPEVLEEMRAADQRRRQREHLERIERAEAFLAQWRERTQTSEPVKPSPSPEAAPHLAPDEVFEEPSPRRESWELFYEPRIVELNAGQIPDLTTVPEQTEPSRSMVTMSALSPREGLSVDSDSFDQVSADSFTRATFFDQGTLNLDTDDAQSSSALSPMPSSDFPVDQAAFSQPPADPAASEENCKTMGTHELAILENIAGQPFDACCGDAIADLPVRDELKDETSFITGYSSPQMEPLRPASPELVDVSALPVEILTMDLYAPDFDAKVNLHAELRRKKLGLDALPQPEQPASSDDISAPSEVMEDLSSTTASPPQQASSESAQTDDSSASLDEPALPKVTLAAPPPQGDIFADVFDTDAPRVVTAPAAAPTARPNLFDDLVLREEFYLPAPPPLQQQQQSTGVFGKIWTNAIALAKASWTKVKSLVWR